MFPLRYKSFTWFYCLDERKIATYFKSFIKNFWRIFLENAQLNKNDNTISFYPVQISQDNYQQGIFIAQNTSLFLLENNFTQNKINLYLFKVLPDYQKKGFPLHKYNNSTNANNNKNNKNKKILYNNEKEVFIMKY